MPQLRGGEGGAAGRGRHPAAPPFLTPGCSTHSLPRGCQRPGSQTGRAGALRRSRPAGGAVTRGQRAGPASCCAQG